MHLTRLLYFIIAFTIFAGCKNNIRSKEDKLYSRHLQRHVVLTVMSTPLPDDKSQMNLLLVNDGQDMKENGLLKIVDSLYSGGQIQPLLIVGIHAGDRMKEYGVAGIPDYAGNGNKADKYASFVENELLPYIRKNSGVRKFKSVAFAGSSLGGLSALDFAWDHADKIDKVGVFSGSLWWRDKNTSDSGYREDVNRIIHKKIQTSRKRPKLAFWFYAGEQEETNDRDQDGVIDVIDDTNDLIAILRKKNVPADKIFFSIDPDGMHNQNSWKRQIPHFLLWAFAK